MSTSSYKGVPIPKGWSMGTSQTQNRPYFYHRSSQHTQWHFPTPAEAKDPVGTKAKMKKLQDFKRKMKQKSDASDSSSSRPAKSLKPANVNANANPSTGNSLAIIVPYRDLHASQQRAKHLAKFTPHMKQFLSNLKSQNKIQDYHIYIIEQSDDQRKFNRGKLLNIGFDYALQRSTRHPPKHNVFIFHDVDLLPDRDLEDWYARYPTIPTHIARVWDRYANNPKYFGGIVSFSEEDMKRINGYPNTFWGWGGEDDEMQNRLEALGIRFDAPAKGTIRDLEDMDLNTKIQFLKKNKQWKCMCKWEALDEHKTTWRKNGLEDLDYEILGGFGRAKT
eukprot:CAMPEP_0171372014 /NCGR_PEP_ID=MMETSP0879-20121228/9018_1 /TAXON_ID=67004 /ORGANISM="Thalassiosira weissflogii, Strain CCMP1336" /LENGTH=333 /DNA_ID=CAMNT_0011880699 /DNA_START=86 /DNA_END=1084 /DNA_ORIENTATION=+